MRRFIFRAVWSQTDDGDCYIVYAGSKDSAECKLRINIMQPRYWQFVCEIKGEVR